MAIGSSPLFARSCPRAFSVARSSEDDAHELSGAIDEAQVSRPVLPIDGRELQAVRRIGGARPTGQPQDAPHPRHRLRVRLPEGARLRERNLVVDFPETLARLRADEEEVAFLPLPLDEDDCLVVPVRVLALQPGRVVAGRAHETQVGYARRPPSCCRGRPRALAAGRPVAHVEGAGRNPGRGCRRAC